jgi:Family of unknown function (DUF5681)
MNELTRRGQFQPGQSGNPAGKPVGARSILTKSLIEDLAEEWREGGRAALKVLRIEKPDKFVLAALSILPKDVLVSLAHQQSPLQAALERASPEEVAMISEGFRLISKIGMPALEALRAMAAQPIEEPRQNAPPASKNGC